MSDFKIGDISNKLEANKTVPTLQNVRVYFQNELQRVTLARYHADKSLCIRLEALDGEPWATATVCMEGTNQAPVLAENQVIIKDWSENTGILSALIAANIVHPPFASCMAGFTSASICNLTDSFARLVKKEGI